MKYYHELYMSDKVSKDKKNILRKIKNSQWQFEVYLIALTKSEKNHLEIFNSVLLIQKAFEKKDLFVVGIADGFENALNLVEMITQEVYDKTKNTDIRNYILQKQSEFEERNV